MLDQQEKRPVFGKAIHLYKALLETQRVSNAGTRKDIAARTWGVFCYKIYLSVEVGGSGANQTKDRARGRRRSSRKLLRRPHLINNLSCHTTNVHVTHKGACICLTLLHR